MNQVQVQIAGLPITLVLFSNGCVALVVHGAMPPVIEIGSELNARLFTDGFDITEGDNTPEEFSYRVAYPLAHYPLLKSWLKQQQLQSPF